MKDRMTYFSSKELLDIFSNPFVSPQQRDNAKNILIRRGKGVPVNYDTQPPFLNDLEIAKLSKMCEVLLHAEKGRKTFPVLHQKEFSELTFSDVQYIIFLYKKLNLDYE